MHVCVWFAWQTKNINILEHLNDTVFHHCLHMIHQITYVKVLLALCLHFADVLGNEHRYVVND